jgi:tetratricopeptide (TPR) repeat protein
MTSNHLLLYRLAELMLQHEQHILPVDLLFDDEQIGDFVKSIQIDSPYHQMLLEGVLTESVRDEKLYVSFTVEGYFHYVLGEVIYNRTEGIGVDALKQIIEESKLNGAKEGVEQYLIRDVQKGELTSLIWLINNWSNSTQVCVYPLANAFLRCSFKSRHKEIRGVLKKLLKNYSFSDINIISDAIYMLEEYNKKEYLEIICLFLFRFLTPKTNEEYRLIIKSLEYTSPIMRKKGLKSINGKFVSLRNAPAAVYYDLAYQYELISDYKNAFSLYSVALKKVRLDEEFKVKLYRHMAQVSLYEDELKKAIHYAKKSNKIIDSQSIQNYFEKECNYSTLGEAYRQKKSYSMALKYQIKSLELSLENFGSFNKITATSYNNLGLVYRSSGEYDLAIHCYEESLRIKENIFSEPNSSIIATLNNLGVVFRYEQRYEDAVTNYSKSLTYSIQINGDCHVMTASILYNLAIAQKNNNDISKGIKNCKKSYLLFKQLLGTNHSTTKLIKDKISELYDL